MKSQAKHALFFYLILTMALACQSKVDKPIDLYSQQWIHGSADCSRNKDELIQVVQYDQNTWILRQNKCINYEAPFMFLFIGGDKALLMDTGATREEETFPLQATVSKIISTWEAQQNKTLELIVAHTHQHGDHYAADDQFRGKSHTTLVGLEPNAVKSFFNITNWPDDVVDFELGNRTLKIIPIPGHQASSIAVYDPSSQLLLTGDTFYPGRLYVNDWHSFKESVTRLHDFVSNHAVTFMLGNHIEMSSTAGIDYPTGTTYQPAEHPLPLTRDDLNLLHQTLQRIGNEPAHEVLSNFIIYPK